MEINLYLKWVGSLKDLINEDEGTKTTTESPLDVG